MKKEVDILEGSIFKNLLLFTLPIALTGILQLLYNAADIIVVGRFAGSNSLAAVGSTSALTNLLVNLFVGLSVGTNVCVAQFTGMGGERAKQLIHKAVHTSICLALAGGIFLTVVGIVFSHSLLRMMETPQDIIGEATLYMRIIFAGMPAMLVYNFGSAILRASGDAKTPLLFLSVSGIVNLIILTVFLLKDKKTVTLHVQEMFHWGEGFAGTYLSKCFPILCNELFYGIGQMLINIVIGRQSESAIAAMAAFRVLEGFVYAFFGGLADASSVVVGKEIGAGRHMKGYQYVKGFTILCPAITFGICLVGVIFNRPLLSLFGLGAEAMEYGKYMLLIYLAAGTVRTCNYIMNTCYRAGGEAIFGTVLEIICLYTISVPATWVAGMVLHLPFLAVFAFLYTDELIRLVFELCYTASGKWVKPVTQEGRATLEEFHEQMAQRRKKKQTA